MSNPLERNGVVDFVIKGISVQAKTAFFVSYGAIKFNCYISIKYAGWNTKNDKQASISVTVMCERNDENKDDDENNFNFS